MVTVRLLGPVEPVLGGQAIALSGLRQRALLAAMALEPGRFVAADLLVEQLWPQNRPSNATGALHQQVFKLRRKLGAAVLERSATGYRLAIRAEDVDARRFETVLRTAREQIATAPATALALLDEGLALWHGHALDGLADFTWAATEARRLEDLRLDAWELRVDALLKLGRPDDAIDELRLLLIEAPLRELAWAMRMVALYRSGRQADALAAYREVRALLVEQLGVEPGPELRSTHERILAQDPTLADAIPPGAVEAPPVADRELIGREEELRWACDLIASQRARLITLTGAPGIGKTRLALAIADRLERHYGLRSVFVPLASITDPHEVLPAIGLALDVGSNESSVKAVARASEGRRLVLILDNFEQLTAASGELTALLDVAAGVTVLVTSRIALRIDKEWVLDVPPLSLPPSRGSASAERLTTTSEAARLFLRRAAEAGHRRKHTSAEAALVAEICHRLDGLPLALELAAARLRHLSLAELSDHLDHRLRILSRDRRDATGRQRTLRSALDASHELLDDDSRTVFARLAVFPAGTSLDGAEAVCGADADVLESLSQLIDSSLLRRVELNGQSRYLMLETVREYALERLDERTDSTEARQRAARYLLELAERRAPYLGAEEDPDQVSSIRAEHDNMLSALAWLRAKGDEHAVLRLAVALSRYWIYRGYRREGLAWLESALESAPQAPAELVANALAAAGTLCCEIPGREEDARRFLIEGERLGRKLGVTDAQNFACVGLTLLAAKAGDLNGSERWAQRMLQLAQQTGNDSNASIALSDLAAIELLRGRWQAAEGYARKALQVGEHLTTARVNLAMALWHQERSQEAAAHACDAAQRASICDDKENLAYALEILAATASNDLPADSVHILAFATRLLEECGIELQRLERQLHEVTLARLQAHLPGHEIERLWENELSTAEIVELGRVVARAS